MSKKFLELIKILFPLSLVIITFSTSCSSKYDDSKEEQISIVTSETPIDKDSLLNSVQGNVSWSQIITRPNSVVLTGLQEHRLVTIYKSKEGEILKDNTNDNSSYSKDYYEYEDEGVEHYVPGIEILYGYNLLNIAHYDLKTEQLNFFFATPSLIKTLYYPSFVQDSLNGKPINRNYYLASVYDEDTNLDTLINKHDLRRFYHFDANCNVKTQLVPADYSAIRSQYDSKNDILYIFSRHDANKNGTSELNEPIHIFWIDLKAPAAGKRLY